LRGRRGKPQGSTWVVRLKQRVRGEWNDSASPSVSFLDISPAKAGREFRARSGSSLGSLDGLKEAPLWRRHLETSPPRRPVEKVRACEVGGGNYKNPLGWYGSRHMFEASGTIRLPPSGPRSSAHLPREGRGRKWSGAPSGTVTSVLVPPEDRWRTAELARSEGAKRSLSAHPPSTKYQVLSIPIASSPSQGQVTAPRHMQRPPEPAHSPGQHLWWSSYQATQASQEPLQHRQVRIPPQR
jgi:hypothetical protein